MIVTLKLPVGMFKSPQKKRCAGKFSDSLSAHASSPLCCLWGICRAVSLLRSALAWVISFFRTSVTQIGDGVDDDMKVNLRVRIMRATNLPSKDAASKITGAHGSCDCYVKVNVANEELFVKPI
jgi:hypothetical protein